MIKELVEIDIILKTESRLESLVASDIVQASSDHAELVSSRFKGVVLDGENLILDISRSIFEKCFFTEIKPKQAIFHKVKFKNCNFSGADLRKAYFKECIFEDCTLLGADLSTIKLDKVIFKSCRIEDAFFIHSRLLKVEFEDLTLNKVSFNNSQLSSCIFNGCILNECNFSDAIIKDSNFPSTYFGVTFGLRSFKGLMLSSTQIMQLSQSLALEIGISVDS